MNFNPPQGTNFKKIHTKIKVSTLAFNFLVTLEWKYQNTFILSVSSGFL